MAHADKRTTLEGAQWSEREETVQRAYVYFAQATHANFGSLNIYAIPSIFAIVVELIALTKDTKIIN